MPMLELDTRVNVKLSYQNCREEEKIGQTVDYECDETQVSCLKSLT